LRVGQRRKPCSVFHHRRNSARHSSESWNPEPLRHIHEMVPSEVDTLIVAKPKRAVIPAKVRIYASHWRWIPAFAGMTIRSERASSWTSIFLPERPKKHRDTSGVRVNASNLRVFNRLRFNTHHSGEGGNPVKYVVRSTQNSYIVCCARHFSYWIPAFAGMANEGLRRLETLKFEVLGLSWDASPIHRPFPLHWPVLVRPFGIDWIAIV
jgi:hypothetical protein